MAVRTYSMQKDGEKLLSPHFKVKEFRCKDGSDKIRIESNLIPVPEKVYDHFGASSITITSGYRTQAHDKKVGGKGSGNHCDGKAVDFVVYKGKDRIPSGKVALYLEDIGVTGIGYRCGGGTYATHMDVGYRTWAKRWYTACAIQTQHYRLPAAFPLQPSHTVSDTPQRTPQHAFTPML